MPVVYLYVPYEMKDTAKSLNCYYDVDTKQWYCHSSNEEAINKFSKRYLEVSYDEKDEAKEKGAKWCHKTKQWYTYNSNKII